MGGILGGVARDLLHVYCKCRSILNEEAILSVCATRTCSFVEDLVNELTPNSIPYSKMPRKPDESTYHVVPRHLPEAVQSDLAGEKHQRIHE